MFCPLKGTAPETEMYFLFGQGQCPDPEFVNFGQNDLVQR